MIYFEVKNLLYTKLNKALSDNGILFVGGTEQIITSDKYGFNL